ncbi:uncharacterized protein LOC134846477 isoform X2 [Symsagittifera roscoffensis]|uniref:uncharacterized protein LOC134846477 isoform X2 n=1 Tax=Symsagittifera roscoffensis TaxID=84072 RepID=UPI00307C39E5
MVRNFHGEESLVFHNETNNHKLAKKRSSKVTFECDFPVSIHDLLTPSEAHWAANPIAPSPCSDPKSPDASGLEEEDETVLTVSDLVALGQMVGRKLNEDDVEHILSQCKDQNDLLDFPQLIEKMEVMTHELQPCTKSELKQAFKIIDQEGKGFITIKQIREMAEKIMPSICSEELESLFDDTLLGEDDSPLRGKNNDDSQKNNGKTQIKDSGDHKNGEGKINAESFIQFIQML